ncbi:MAG: 2-C-methyl-D-erythritol 2,4-cyclodiphosphate synthase [Balneolaceae bacterium]
MTNIRIGLGYDVHAFGESEKLVLGGVNIPYEKGLKGHSDADVLLHAITDALLGSLALGDIGTHFPDTDPAYKNADSLLLLKSAYKLVTENGYKVVNVDTTVIAEDPKLKPFIPQIRTRISGALGCDTEQVSVKATTSEKMGFAGRKEGIAVHAVVLVQEI